MSDHANRNETLRAIASILLICFLISMALLLVMFGLITLAGERAYAIHHKLFGITESDFALAIELLIGGFKLAAFGLFGIPWAAIRIYLNRAA